MAVDPQTPPAARVPESVWTRERRLREALEAIVIRCEEGDPRTDWLPTIARIAKEALGRGR